jgi:hypothetical protein
VRNNMVGGTNRLFQRSGCEGQCEPSCSCKRVYRTENIDMITW